MRGKEFFIRPSKASETLSNFCCCILYKKRNFCKYSDDNLIKLIIVWIVYICTTDSSVACSKFIRDITLVYLYVNVCVCCNIVCALVNIDINRQKKRGKKVLQINSSSKSNEQNMKFIN